MTGYLLEMFMVSLALTIVIELAVAFLLSRWGGVQLAKCQRDGEASRFALFGTKKGALLVILVNVLTNPAAVLLSQLGKRYLWAVPGIVTELSLEALVVAVEALIYCSFAKSPGWRIDRPVRLAVTANVCSGLTGVIIRQL